MNTEQPNPSSQNLDRKGTREILDLINREDKTVAGAVACALDSISAAVDEISRRLTKGGSLIYVGSGTSGRLGILDAVECSPTFGIDSRLVFGVLAGGAEAIYKAIEGAEDLPSAGAEDLKGAGLRKSDAVVGISASGRTPYTVGAMGYARCLGALTIGISCNSEAPLSREVDIPIEIETGSEIIAGSTRMKAGTAQKMVLNMISTATMIRLGHVYDNLMVNLQPKNQKLISRAVTIVSQITEAPREEAARALKDCGSVTAAAAFLKFRCSIGEAKRLSQEYSNLRELLEADIAKK